jgi:hypothetical protein
MEHQSRGEPHDTMGVLAHPAYAATRARVALDDGLHSMHSTVEAWPAERPTQGLHRQAVSSRIRPAQHRRGQTQAAAMTGRHGTPQSMRQLKVAGEHVTILVARGGDG